MTVVLAALSTAGCPGTKRHTLVPDVPRSGDRDARVRFQEARVSFERDGVRDAARFQAIAEEYPDDPVASYAHLYAGIAAFENGEHATAVRELEALDEEPDADPRLLARGHLFRGMAEVHLGDYEAAAKHLRAGEPALAGDEKSERRAPAYFAEAYGRGGQAMRSLSHYDAWFRTANGSEKAFITSRLQTIAEAFSAEDATRAYERSSEPDSVVTAVMGWQVARNLRASGDIARARGIETAIRATRMALGLPVAGDGDESGAGDPSHLAAVLPITGRRARVGEPALRGLSLAAGAFPSARAENLAPFHLAVHDTQSTVPGARSALESAAGGRAMAIVGPVDGKIVDAVAPLADGRSVPLISLNLRSGRRVRDGSRYIFHIQLSAEDRAEELARHAVGRGVRKVAILRPDNGYGRAVGKAFQAQFEALDGTIVKEVVYKPATTSFGSKIAGLGQSYEAIFIPEQARRLTLIAPALAAADLRVTALSSLDRARERQARRRKPTARPIGLLCTAEFVDAGFLRSAGRYIRGAVLAPGFFPDRGDPIIREFVDRFELAFNTQPTALDAYAYDAAHILRKAIAEGVSTRTELADTLAKTQLEGLTGTIEFDDKHRRADSGLLFTVKKAGSEFTIRAMR